MADKHIINAYWHDVHSLNPTHVQGDIPTQKIFDKHISAIHDPVIC